MTDTRWGAFWAAVAIAVVAVAVYAVGFYDDADRTYYQCETGEPLEPGYQLTAGEERNPNAGDIYSYYRGDDTPEQIARACSQQVANAYTRALACGLIVAVDDVDESALWSEIGSSEHRIGPFIVWSMGDYDADYRLMVNRGGEWEESSIANLPFHTLAGSGADDLRETCEGVGGGF